MKLLKWLAIGLVALLAVLLVGGLMLPRTFAVEREVLIAADAPRVYALVAQPKQWQAWSAWNRRDPAMEITYSGPDEGEGAVWAWKSKSEGDGVMTMTGAEPPHRIGYRLHFPDFESDSTGYFSFTPEAGGTRVVWRMDGDVGPNPLYRWMPLLMRGAMDRDFDAGLSNLKVLAEARG